MSGISFLPAHLTHIIIAGIFASAATIMTALEVYFIKSFNSSETFFMIMQNIGILFTSGYFIGKVTVSPSGLTESTSKP